MATKNTILGTVPKSRGRYTEGDTTTKWYYDNILEYKGSSFRCISKASTGITGAPAIYDANTHTLFPNAGWEFFVDTTGALDVEERLTENKNKLYELDEKTNELNELLNGKLNYIERYILDRSGNLVANDSASTSDKIMASNGDTLFFSFGTLPQKSYIILYDSNDNYLDDYGIDSSSTSRSITISNINISYVRFSFELGFSAYVNNGASIIWSASRTSGYIEENTNRVESVADNISTLKGSLINDKYNVADLSLMTIIPNSYDGDGKMETNASYKTLQFIASSDFDCYFEHFSELIYVSITSYNNGEISYENSNGRYRHKSGEEDTLPTSTNKLSIKKGELVNISLYIYDTSLPLFMTNSLEFGFNLNDLIPLTKKMRLELNKLNFIKYVNESGYE